MNNFCPFEVVRHTKIQKPVQWFISREAIFLFQCIIFVYLQILPQTLSGTPLVVILSIIRVNRVKAEGGVFIYATRIFQICQSEIINIS